MPSLTWPGKHLARPQPTTLIPDSIIFPGGRGYPEAARSGRLILGDNLRVMSGLLAEYEGRLDLIYADPPFFTNRAYPARIGRGEDSRKPEQWVLGEGYGDRWPHLDAYLEFLHQRLSLMHRLLSPTGSLYLHLDWHANSYARILLDEIFGADHLLNEIVWTYHGPSPIKRAFNRKHDTLLAYVKGEGYTFNSEAVREAYNPSTLKTFRASPKAGFGKVPDLERGKVPEDWWYFPVVARLHKERTGYPTQKPESLLERIILASSNQDGLVADFFCGSGTAPVVASRLGRRFIAGDSSFRAVHTTRRRLCALPAAPFSLEREESQALPHSDAPGAAVERTPDEVRVRTEMDLDYWEVDPAWDGSLFRSAVQAYRTNGSADLPHRLEINTGGNACVRMVTTEGVLLQRELHV
jgi:DNA modification methylase